MEQQFSCALEVIHGDTVTAVHAQMPPVERLSRLADVYKMFSDVTRVRILWALECNELCVCDLAALLNMTTSAISHQLKSLRMANLVKPRREGKTVYYSLADEHVKIILDMGLEHVMEGGANT